jgi:hypothetical protein
MSEEKSSEPNNNIEDEANNKWNSLSFPEKFILAVKSITIEPIVLIHLTAILMTYITTMDLILDRACIINMNYPREICEALAERYVQTLKSVFASREKTRVHFIFLSVNLQE